MHQLSLIVKVRLAVCLLLAAAATQAAGPTGLLNDTGQTRCLNTAGNALEACSATNTGNNSPRPGQDGRFGRDPAAGNPGLSGFSKPAGSGGSGGFAFTPLDVNGTAIALTGTTPVPSVTPRCIKDNVTNLIWEVKTTSGLQNQDNTYSWGANTTDYITNVNALNLCGETANDWRLPTRRELLSIVDHNRSPSPVIDISYFPNTVQQYYWSADVYAPNTTQAWLVSFNVGDSVPGNKTAGGSVRLVRDGP